MMMILRFFKIFSISHIDSDFIVLFLKVNWMIDRDLQVSYIIVDEMHHEHPELIKDQYWDEMFPDIPNTIASQNIKDSIPLPSTANVEPKKGEDETVPTHTSVIINDLVCANLLINFKRYIVLNLIKFKCVFKSVINRIIETLKNQLKNAS